MKFKRFGIIGGGLLGRLASFLLVEGGHSVSIFEKSGLSPSLGRNRSAAFTSAGLLSPFTEKETGGEYVFNLGMKSMNILRVVDKLVSRSIGYGIGFKQLGCLIVSSVNDRSYAHRLFQRIDFKQTVMTKERALSYEPNLASNLAAWFIPDEGHLNPTIAMKNLHSASLNKQCDGKAQWYFNCEIKEFGPGWIKTKEKKLLFDWVLDFRGLGTTDNSIRGVRGENFLLKVPKGFTLKYPIRFIHPRAKVYIVPREEDTILVGSTEIESEDLSEVSVESALELLGAARFILPVISEARIIGMDCNLRPANIDNLPKKELVDGLISINGLFRHGWLLAPALLCSLFEEIDLKFSGLINEIYES